MYLFSNPTIHRLTAHNERRQKYHTLQWSPQFSADSEHRDKLLLNRCEYKRFTFKHEPTGVEVEGERI